MGLDVQTAAEYWQAMTVVDARERLMDMRVGDYSSKESDDSRKKYHQHIQSLAYPNESNPHKKILKSEEVADILRRKLGRRK